MARETIAVSTPSVPIAYELFLMRHGAAVPRGRGRFAEDFNRPLTRKGAQELPQIGGGLKNAGVRLDWIVSGPLVRAWQTGEILRSVLGANVPLSSCDHLRPGGTLEGLLAFLVKHSGKRRILIVGHEPPLSRWAAQLLGASSAANLRFKKGGCCLITLKELPPKIPGRLIWWVTPRLLRKLA
ncbi:MAG: phosphohistidine phosphatase SixA [Acidobacteriia bacterium]|nr:phosphohistidine phosphatase SixA [Terriglobia bacterium]